MVDSALANEAPASPVRVAGISPTPDADVVAAITVAVLEAWPKQSASAPPPAPDVHWRFGQRRWQERSVPRRTWGV